VEVLLEGRAPIRFTHPDDFREWVRTHKRREPVEKLLSAREAVAQYVADGDYIAYDFSSLTRGPQALVREIIRQRRRELWVCAEFTLHETALLTGDPVCLVPALNPDVFLCHVHQADLFGNARIFGTNLFALEAATAAKKVIVSTEEIIDPGEIRQDPARTTIPYFLVDAVVYAPFGCHPGGTPGMYEMDIAHFQEWFAAERTGMDRYLEQYIHSVASHTEYLEKRVGVARLMELKRAAQSELTGFGVKVISVGLKDNALARVLKVDERSLVVKRAPPKRAVPPSATSKQVVAESQPGAKPAPESPWEASKLEAYCLGALLKTPELLYKADRQLQDLGLPKLAPEDFARTELQLLFRAFTAALEQFDSDALDHVRENLDPALEPRLTALIQESDVPAATDARAVDDLMARVLQLRKDTLKEWVGELRFLEEAAQEQGDRARLYEYQKEKIQQMKALTQLDQALARKSRRGETLPRLGMR